MSALWTATEAAEATGGEARGDWTVSGLSIDTRSIQPGELFVALKDRRDGHDFVVDALAKGAGAALVSRVPGGVAPDAPLLLVADVQAGLEALGRAGRARSRARVIAVTGSVGKTSTKEMLRQALAPLGQVHAAEKSFNNQWGVPLTLARLPRDADFAVIEIGMNHPGEIAPLAVMAAPHLAMITTVAAAHLAAFDGLDGIAREKASIFSGLGPEGIAVLNGDLETTPLLLAGAARAARVLRFGETPQSEARLTGLSVGDTETRFTAQFSDRAVPVRLNTPGRHFAMNALAALTAVEALDGDLPKAAVGLSNWRPVAGRGTRETVALPQGGFELIDDAYNANPTSLGAALEVLAAASPGPDGRKQAFLGDMLELGPQEIALHAELVQNPALQQIDQIHCVGPLMRHLWQALPEAQRGTWTATAPEMCGHLPELIRPNDLVLVKGSLGVALRHVVAGLRDLAPDAS